MLRGAHRETCGCRSRICPSHMPTLHGNAGFEPGNNPGGWIPFSPMLLHTQRHLSTSLMPQHKETRYDPNRSCSQICVPRAACSLTPEQVQREKPHPGGQIPAGNDATSNYSCISSCLSTIRLLGGKTGRQWLQTKPHY